MAHRVIYESVYGEILEGLTLDHLCFNTLCVRPDHLEPVSVIENVMRGGGWAARNARKTHCPRGHEYSKQKSARVCRTCINDAKRKKRLGNRQPPKTHCAAGHPFAGENLIIHKSGYRRCRICVNEWQRDHKKRKREAAQALCEGAESEG